MKFISKLLEIIKEIHISQYEILIYIIIELIKKA